jgi:hypothetical protein
MFVFSSSRDVLTNPPEASLGAAALALHYANLIVHNMVRRQAERNFERHHPASVDATFCGPEEDGGGPKSSVVKNATVAVHVHKTRYQNHPRG